MERKSFTISTHTSRVGQTTTQRDKLKLYIIVRDIIDVYYIINSHFNTDINIDLPFYIGPGAYMSSHTNLCNFSFSLSL